MATVDDFTGADGSAVDTTTIWDKTTNPTPTLTIQSNSAAFTSGTNGGYTSLDAICIRSKSNYAEAEVVFWDYEFTMIDQEMDVDLGFKGGSYIDWYMAGSADGYFVHLRPFEYGLTLRRVIGDATVTLDSCTFTEAVGHNPSLNEKWNIAIRHTGAELQAFVWQAGTDRPSTPCLSAADTTYTGPGKVSIGGGNGAVGARTWRVGAVTVNDIGQVVTRQRGASAALGLRR